MDRRQIEAWLKGRSFFPLVRPFAKLLERPLVVRDLMYDRKYHIHTTPSRVRLKVAEFDNEPFGTATELPDRVPYEPTQYPTIEKIIGAIRLGPTDQVFDIGCGAGRALCLFARRSVARCVGIEYVPWVAAAARRNAANLRGRKATIEIRAQDARLADYSGGTIYYFFNPFSGDISILEEVLRRIHATLETDPRSIQVIHLHPQGSRTGRTYDPIQGPTVHALMKSGFLRYMNTIEVPLGLYRRLDAGFWSAP